MGGKLRSSRAAGQTAGDAAAKEPELAERIDRLMAHKARFAELGIVLTERRALALLLAFSRSISVADFSAAALAASEAVRAPHVREQLRNLRHRHAAYQTLRKLAARGMLERTIRHVAGDPWPRVYFRVRRAIREKIADIMREIGTAGPR